MAKTTKAALRLTDCDVIAAALLVPASIAPRGGQNDGPFQERAMEAFESLLLAIAERGGTATMRQHAERAALRTAEESDTHLEAPPLKAK